MSRILRAVQAATVAGCVMLTPVLAAHAQSNLEGTEEAIKQSAKQILRALTALMMSIPQFESPETLDNGEIIIRRKRKESS